MKVDLHSIPPALPFGEGESAFKLNLRPLQGSDSAMCLDAVGSGSFADMFHTASRLVIGWENVNGLDGQPIPFERIDENTNRLVSQFNRFLGAIPMIERLVVLGGILAFCGIPTPEIKKLIEAITKAAIDLDPTRKPAGDTKKDALPE